MSKPLNAIPHCKLHADTTLSLTATKAVYIGLIRSSSTSPTSRVCPTSTHAVSLAGQQIICSLASPSLLLSTSTPPPRLNSFAPSTCFSPNSTLFSLCTPKQAAARLGLAAPAYPTLTSSAVARPRSKRGAAVAPTTRCSTRTARYPISLAGDLSRARPAAVLGQA